VRQHRVVGACEVGCIATRPRLQARHRVALDVDRGGAGIEPVTGYGRVHRQMHRLGAVAGVGYAERQRHRGRAARCGHRRSIEIDDHGIEYFIDDHTHGIAGHRGLRDATKCEGQLRRVVDAPACARSHRGSGQRQ